MRNSGSVLTRARRALRAGRVPMTAVAVWLAVCAAASAQGGTPPTAKQRFDSATAKEDAVRVVLANGTDPTPAKSLATRVSQVVTSFETLVRRFPTSGYADDALWRAAGLADASYQRLNRPEDRDKALKMYRWLVQEYPTSSYVKEANSKIAALNVSEVAADAPSPSAPAADAAPAPDRATLTSIQRVVMPDAVRITLELDREVTYKEDRIGGPARLFFDLKNVEVTSALKDAVLTYGSDVVSKIRVGRHPGNVVRVVLDFEDVRRYSVFTLYSPFRLVIDAERSVAVAAIAPTAAVPPKAATVSVAIPAPPPPKPTLIEEPVPAAPVPEIPATPASASPPPPIEARPTAPAANAAGGFSIARQLGLSVSRIVIDPGHGGHDPGTLARGLTEAQLTLDVALRLEKLLAKDPGVEVVLTRRTDVYIPLEERTAIANRSNADLFLSIHANSSRNTAASGIETYFLSFASSPDAEAIAARENSASEREMHQLPDIIKAISLNNKLDESRDLANMVQDAMMANLKKSNREVRSRGVKKAPFVVLIGAQMPSVLAEISFITNRRELQLLKTAGYKQRIAESLYNAIVTYRKSLKGAAAATIER